MRKIDSDEKILLEIVDLKDKVVLDIGCGTGNLVRWMTEMGAIVTGLDTPEILKKAREFEKRGNENYLMGGGENIPVDNSTIDLILFVASFHHISLNKMSDALNECERVLKPKGLVIFIEPVAEKNSYYEIIKLVEDEAEIQEKAYEAIKNASFEQIDELLFFMERSINDYIQLLNIFVEDKIERDNYIKEAKKITINLAEQKNVIIEDYRYKSVSRLIIMRKI